MGGGGNFIEMKKLYLILKILIILAILIAVGYLVTTPDSEVILKKPWFRKTGDTNYGINENFSAKLEIHDSGPPKSLVIQNNGAVIFREGDKTNQVKISPREIESLRQNILDSGFFSLNEKYEGTGCCDFISHTITVTIGDKTRSVFCYNECPKEFEDMIEKIKSLWPYNIEYYGFS